MTEMSLFLRRSARSLPGCVAAFAGGLVSEYRRAMLLRIYRALGHRDIDLAIEPVTVRELIGDDTRAIALRELDIANGNVSAFELATIAKLVADRRPQTMLEIGTFDGRTTLNLAANAPEDARVYTLDLPREGLGETRFDISRGDRHYVDKPASGARFAGTEPARRITQLYGDSATFDFSPFEGAIDLVFVDGAHTYDYVISDSQAALRLLRGGRGTILWHDYDSWPDVTRALHDLSRTREFAGMRRIEGGSLVILER